MTELKTQPAVLGAFVLSTCNRTELYAHLLDGAQGIDLLKKALFSLKGVPQDTIRDHFYYFVGGDVVRHLFRVAAGLESMAIGEKEILGQVKESFQLAREMGSFSREFHLLSNMLRTGKRVRTETRIDYGGSSMSWAAVKKAEEKLGGLAQKSMLIIGSGKMGHLALRYLSKKSLKDLFVVNRRYSIARERSEKYGGRAVPFFEIKSVLQTVDAVICAAGAPHYILDQFLIHKILPLRKKPSLLLIDISVPSNIDPAVAGLPNVQFFSIDDLKDVIEASSQRRRNSVEEATQIIRRQKDLLLAKLEKTTISFSLTP